MYCMYCGTELTDGICPRCQENDCSGKHITKTVIYANGKKIDREPTSAKIFSIICIAMGALGMLGYGYPYLSIAAIVFAFLYKSKIRSSNGLTKAGNILGIVGLVVNTIIIVASAIISAVVAVVGAIVSFVCALAYCLGFVEELYGVIMSYVSYLI